MNAILKTKKWLSVGLMFVLLLSAVSISGCSFFKSGDEPKEEPVAEVVTGISEEAQAVIDAIAGLGTITLKSEDAIAAAEAAYAALTDEQKAEVENYDVLLDARSAINQLKLQSFAVEYLLQAKEAFVKPADIVINHVYVQEDMDQRGTYYLVYDITAVNLLGMEETATYGNKVPVAMEEGCLDGVAASAALSGLIGSNYWVEGCTLDDAKELNAEAIQADYLAAL